MYGPQFYNTFDARVYVLKESQPRSPCEHAHISRHTSDGMIKVSTVGSPEQEPRFTNTEIRRTGCIRSVLTDVLTQGPL